LNEADTMENSFSVMFGQQASTELTDFGRGHEADHSPPSIAEVKNE